MKRISALFFSTFIMMSVPGIAWAQISLSITTEVNSANLPELAVLVKVANGGKESAHRLRMTIQAGSARVSLPEVQELKPNSNHDFSASLQTTTTKSGTYPVFVTLAYSDLNGYSFSAIGSASYSAGGASSSDIFGILTASPIAEKGDLKLKLKNNSSEERVVTLTPILPVELTPGGLPGKVTLSAGAEQELAGSIANFSALSGSRYPIFISAEYETADQHFTNVMSSFVDILPRQSIFSRYQNWFIAAAALFLLAALRQMLKARKPRRPKSEPTPG